MVLVLKVLMQWFGKWFKCGFFDCDVWEVVYDLIGVMMFVDGVGGIIVEVEVYYYIELVVYFYNGLMFWNQVMFGLFGYVYVYCFYGIYWCVNFVCEVEGLVSVVLICVLEFFYGIVVMCCC